MIGRQTTNHPFNQSEVRLQPIVTGALTFSRTLGRLSAHAFIDTTKGSNYFLDFVLCIFRAHISKKVFKKPAKYSSKYLSLIPEENKINTSFAKEIGIEYESDLCSNEIGIDCSFFFYLSCVLPMEARFPFLSNQRYQKLKRCHFTLTKDLFANKSQQPVKRRQSDKLD